MAQLMQSRIENLADLSAMRLGSYERLATDSTLSVNNLKDPKGIPKKFRESELPSGDVVQLPRSHPQRLLLNFTDHRTAHDRAVLTVGVASAFLEVCDDFVLSSSAFDMGLLNCNIVALRPGNGSSPFFWRSSQGRCGNGRHHSSSGSKRADVALPQP